MAELEGEMGEERTCMARDGWRVEDSLGNFLHRYEDALRA
jgi:hypothetical protein